VSNGWRNAYAELKVFAKSNPNIKVSPNVVRIPEDVRPQFYRLFDAVRSSFLEDNFPVLLADARPLSESYIKLEQEVVNLMGLAGIEIPASLDRFLHDPTTGLRRVLFDPLFSLLAGVTKAEAFSSTARETVERFFKALYSSGYEKWVILSLLKLLASDKVFNIELPDPVNDGIHTDAEKARDELVPDPEELDRLLLRPLYSPFFAVPDFIVHSAKTGRYVSLRTKLDDAAWKASNASDKREWLPLYSISDSRNKIPLQPELTIYIDDAAEDIALVADMDRICRPDLIIECLTPAAMPRKTDLDRIKFCHNALRPKLGTYLVCRQPVPGLYTELLPEQEKDDAGEPVTDKEAASLDGGIHILDVGFDQSKLDPIISVLMNRENGKPAAVAQDS
jgi:hypothetical protein